MAFVIDAYTRRIVGRRTATTQLVLDAIEHAIWTRQLDGIEDLTGLIHHNDQLNPPNTRRSRSPTD
ncbi:hypothetical protein [Mycolicibacterium peregrinum]|uniref:hypothetical protein n=1 Tax=Mycolicibacterium peregrinum TaxID=43304 RepID=UPI003AF36670